MSTLSLPAPAQRAVTALERAQGLPGWAAVPLTIGSASLLTAVVGLFWDVAYHVDHGRDVNLLTGPHVLILLGLMGLGAAAASSIALASVDGRPGWRVGPLRVPYAAAPLAATSLAAVIGFPLDDLWHRTYGIDVTLWSPTHILMIGGAVLSTFAFALFPAEAALHGRSRPPNWRMVSLAGSPCLGLSVFALEFDFGIPQWQALYHPLLVVVALTLTLVAARALLGAWGAVKAALFFLFMRSLYALLVGPGLGHTLPRFPIALGIAASVELGFHLARNRGVAATALLSGLLAGTAGLATEWVWQSLVGRLAWTPELLPMLWVPIAGGLLAALVGIQLGRVWRGERPGLPAAVTVAAILGIALLFAVPSPRHSVPLSAHLSTTPVGAPRTARDRSGVPVQVQDVSVDVRLDQPKAAEGSDWFTVTAWQGGGQRDVRLVEVGPGHYRSAEPVPTGGSWKSMVFLARGDLLAALPVSFPPDPQYRSAGYPLQAEKDAGFVPASQLLLTEAHGGAPWVAAAAYVALYGMVALWIGLLLVAHRAVSRKGGDRTRNRVMTVVD